MTLGEYLKNIKVRISSNYLGIFRTSGLEHDKWNVQVRKGNNLFKTMFTKGLGLRSNGFVVNPIAEDVIACLVTDAQAGEESFDEFCRNYGYDNDSIKTLDIYRKCQKASIFLKEAFSEEEMDKIQELLTYY